MHCLESVKSKDYFNLAKILVWSRFQIAAHHTKLIHQFFCWLRCANYVNYI